MPILAREIDLYPSNLLERASAANESGVGWTAVYTRSRLEKELMRRLRVLDVAFYAPLVPKMNRSPAGRVRTAWVPLFSNYVFVYGNADDVYRAHTTNCVSRVIEVSTGGELTHDLAQIHRLIESGTPLTIESKLQPGRRVRVKTGMLLGQEGTIIQRRGERRLLVAVNFLQQGASVLFDDFEVEAID